MSGDAATDAPAPGSVAPSGRTTAWPRLAAIVLSGGRGSRLGGVSKAALRVGEDSPTLLDGVLDAATRLGADPIVVVGEGPASPRRGVLVTREDPPFGGPLAALGAGLALVPEDCREVLVLACDLPRATDLVVLLEDAVEPGRDGAAVIDEDGQMQWLAARYRIAALRRVLAAAGEPHGGSVNGGPLHSGSLHGGSLHGGSLHGGSLRSVLRALDLTPLGDTTGAADDVDTPEDLAHAVEYAQGDRERRRRDRDTRAGAPS